MPRLRASSPGTAGEGGAGPRATRDRPTVRLAGRVWLKKPYPGPTVAAGRATTVDKAGTSTLYHVVPGPGATLRGLEARAGGFLPIRRIDRVTGWELMARPEGSEGHAVLNDEPLNERLGRLEASLDRLTESFDAFRAHASEQLANARSHSYYHSIEWNGFTRDFGRFVLDVEDRQRDLTELFARRAVVPNPNLRVVTDHPVAADTVDHLHPRGAAHDNTRQPRFVAACEALFAKPLRHLDIGCAGGGLVWDFTQRGHLSVGIEGSDWCRRTQRAEWRTIPERLFTADVRHPFRVEDGAGRRQLFDVVTAWEVFEHIPAWAVPALLQNVDRHLGDDGLLVASVATFADCDGQGRQYHATVQTREWWVAALRQAGFEEVESPFAVGDYPRGSGNPRAGDWNAASDPHLGFHIVAKPRATRDGGTREGRRVAGNDAGTDGAPSPVPIRHAPRGRVEPDPVAREDPAVKGDPVARELEITRRLATRCVFVMGHGRSGTSIVQQLINASPQALILGEARFYLKPRQGSFRDAYNDRHASNKNQVCKSTYAPSFLPADTYHDWLQGASARYRWLGDKLAFNHDLFRQTDPKKIRDFFESRFFASKYIFMMREPMQTLLSQRRLLAAGDDMMPDYAIGWARWVQMWADMVRTFPNVLTIFTDRLGSEDVARIGRFLDLDLAGGEALLNFEERRHHDGAEAPSLARWSARLDDAYGAVRQAAAGDPILWQANQRVDLDVDGSRNGDAATRSVGYPLGLAWAKAEKLILALTGTTSE